MPWYKGNIHSHSSASDGSLTPVELALYYKTLGYDFMVVTDHGLVTGVEHISNGEFLVLRGEELSSPHMLGLGLDQGIPDDLELQSQVDAIRNGGGLPILAHPAWTGMWAEEVAALEGLVGIEISNQYAEELNGNGTCLGLWDELLDRGCPCLGFAVDDLHAPRDAHGWISVQAAELERVQILQAIEAGQFYSSTGPTIEGIAVTPGQYITVNCSPCCEIVFSCAANYGQRVSGAGLTTASFQFEPHMKYCRVECRDGCGKVAWSNPVVKGRYP